MSLKSSLWRYLGLLAIAALAVGVFAGPASAKKLSAKQRAHVRKQLRKQIKKHPGVINRKSFVKRASLVNFKLPVTIKLRGANAANNPNDATVDLGTSLGTRTVNLGGSLAATIVFHDSYDGGALGNVDLQIESDGVHTLKSTSIPILWNDQVTQPGTSWDSTLLSAAGFPDSTLSALGHAPGCADVTSANPHASSANPQYLGFGNGTPAAAPGVPIYADLAAAQAHNSSSIMGFAAAHLTGTSVDNTLDAIKSNGAITNTAVDNNNVGNNSNPFPVINADTAPGGPNQASDAKNVVLRTNALDLDIAQPGTEVGQADAGYNNSQQVRGSQNIVIGKSGGQANLFGKIPGKDFGIDVTVNLATRINSIIRIVDQDAFEPLFIGGNWPAAVFSCAQVWTGGIQNYIPAVRLAGNLKIAPGLTADGHLRIAKATVSSLPGYNARFAVAACLMPYTSYNTETTTAANLAVQQPNGTNGPLLADSQAPVDYNSVAPAPAADCNPATGPGPLVKNSALPPSTVGALSGGNQEVSSAFYVGDGSSASVAADLKVNNVALDVVIGRN